MVDHKKVSLGKLCLTEITSQPVGCCTNLMQHFSTSGLLHTGVLSLFKKKTKKFMLSYFSI